MQRTFREGATSQFGRWRGWTGRSILGALLSAAGTCFVLQDVPCTAQIDQGTIVGTVTDPSGAVVPSAQITLTENDTGLVTAGVTQSNGSRGEGKGDFNAKSDLWARLSAHQHERVQEL